LARQPGFAATAILTLALGIGANTAIFTVVSAVLLRPLSYPQPDRIVRAYWQWPDGETPNVTATQYAFWRDNSSSFEDVAAYSSAGAGYNLAGGTEPERVQGLPVSEAFFRVLGVNMALGRAFLADEDRPNGPHVAVITEGLWRAYFAADPELIGKHVQL